jgi:hypothetical protein
LFYVDILNSVLKVVNVGFQGGWNDWSERTDPETGKTSFVPSAALYTDYRYLHN